MRFFRSGFRPGKGKETVLLFFGVLFLAVCAAAVSADLCLPGSETNLNAYTTESEAFREMDFGKDGLWRMQQFAEREELDFPEVVAVTMIWHAFHFPEDFERRVTAEQLAEVRDRLRERKPEAYEKCLETYREILDSLVCFPVPENAESEEFVTYENSWRWERTFGGERTHEGTDLMAGEKPRGYYPVVSISDGVIEQVGWLKLGGWRVGVRSEEGVYFYYAHLASYAVEWQEGDPVSAGELLGWMGDSGYGEEEGTTGMFPVHLHLGIYRETDHFSELSLNPYGILRYLEHFRLQAVY